jgi:phosphinothricin acetyltransferase
LLAVYKPYVETTANTFEYEVPLLQEYKGRVEAVLPGYPWLVCEADGKIIGYAYGHKHRDRTAYQWSPESTIYLSQDYHGKGIARILYEALFAILKLQGFINVYAGVLSTNTGSNKLHRAMGFGEIGLFKNIGYKLGEWHSNIWYELAIREHMQDPATPKTMAEIIRTEKFMEIMDTANSKMKNIALSYGHETPLREMQ